MYTLKWPRGNLFANTFFTVCVCERAYDWMRNVRNRPCIIIVYRVSFFPFLSFCRQINDVIRRWVTLGSSSEAGNAVSSAALASHPSQPLHFLSTPPSPGGPKQPRNLHRATPAATYTRPPPRTYSLIVIASFNT